MDRLSLNQGTIDTLRAQIQAWEIYADKSEPLPGTALKLDDDIEWLGVIKARVLWGYELPEYCFVLCPDIDPEGYTYFEGIYITDRAPADPNETPMPIYPQQAQQRQSGQTHDPKRALHELIKRLDHNGQKKVRELVKANRPELLTDEHAAPNK